MVVVVIVTVSTFTKSHNVSLQVVCAIHKAGHEPRRSPCSGDRCCHVLRLDAFEEFSNLLSVRHLDTVSFLDVIAAPQCH